MARDNRKNRKNRKDRTPPSKREISRKYSYLRGPDSVVLSIPAVAQLVVNVTSFIRSLDDTTPYTVFVYFRRYPNAEAAYQAHAASGSYKVSGHAQSNPKKEPVVMVVQPRLTIDDELPAPPEIPVLLIGDSTTTPCYTINELIEFVAENSPTGLDLELGPESYNALMSS